MTLSALRLASLRGWAEIAPVSRALSAILNGKVLCLPSALRQSELEDVVEAVALFLDLPIEPGTYPWQSLPGERGAVIVVPTPLVNPPEGVPGSVVVCTSELSAHESSLHIPQEVWILRDAVIDLVGRRFRTDPFGRVAPWLMETTDTPGMAIRFADGVLSYQLSHPQTQDAELYCAGLAAAIGALLEGVDLRVAQWSLVLASNHQQPNQIVGTEASLIGKTEALRRAFYAGLVHCLEERSHDLRRPLRALGRLNDAPGQPSLALACEHLAPRLRPELGGFLRRLGQPQIRPDRAGPPAPVDFVGREDALQRLRALLEPADRVHTTVLHGPAGIGKTALAAKLVEQIAPNQEAVWISLAKGLETGFLQVADALGIDTRLPGPPGLNSLPGWMTGIHKFLRASTYLLVVDDVDDVDEELEDGLALWLPNGYGRCSVLVLSRRPFALQSTHDAVMMGLGPLTSEEAGELLRRRVPVLDDQTNLEELVDQTAGHPLALALAAAIVEQHGAGQATAHFAQETAPKALVDMARASVETLSPDQQNLMSALVVCAASGSPPELPLRLARIRDSEALPALSQRALTVSGSSKVRLHPLVRSIFDAELAKDLERQRSLWLGHAAASASAMKKALETGDALIQKDLYADLSLAVKRTTELCEAGNEVAAEACAEAAVELTLYPRGRLRSNLCRAAAAFRAALKVVTRNESPRQWASLQVYLGKALTELAVDRQEDLKPAIEAFKAAITVDNRADLPEDWADCQQSLGNALALVPDSPESLRLAADAFKAAMTVYSQQTAPGRWALSLVMLGNTLARIEGDPERVIRSYEQAMTVLSRETDPRRWATCQHIIGEVWAKDRTKNPERAATAFTRALTVFSADVQPWAWARSKTAVAFALLDQHPREAAEHFSDALAVYTQQEFPRQRAIAQRGLAMAMLRLPGCGGNLNRAIAAFRAALTVFSPTENPEVWAETKKQLGQALKRNQHLAAVAYRSALSLNSRGFPEIESGRREASDRLPKEGYATRMRLKYAAVDLANLMPSYVEDPGRLVIRDVLVPQEVCENPGPVEIPKDLQEQLQHKGLHELDRSKPAGRHEPRDGMEGPPGGFVSQPPRCVLDVIGEPGNRLLVLVGDPGSGKSTLLRYLLLELLEPQPDSEWTAAFIETFPVLIELRDFIALRQAGECATFLEYAGYMDRTERWGISESRLYERLRAGPSLVMFDGLDEIFDRRERERVMEEVIGFAGRFQLTRIIVTSRPVGYHGAILRAAGFLHYGLRDLDGGRIESFTRGWFALTFPQSPDLAEQRIKRVLSSVRGSRPIRLLAGNPMLLTIMVLLAREQDLPRGRAEFYEKAVEVLAHHWDANRNLTLNGVEYANVEDKKGLLRRIAMRMQTSPGGLSGNFIHEDELEQEITTWFTERFPQLPHEAIRAARAMIDTLQSRNYVLCLRGPRLYGFIHRTFLEYLTAAEYVRRFGYEQTLEFDGLVALFDEHCTDAEWREILSLICGQIAERFVAKIIEHLLIGRMDVRRWGGESYVPELVLTIGFLLEVQVLNSLDGIGPKLLERTIQYVEKAGNYPDTGRLLADIISLCEGIGFDWPGVRKFLFQLPEFESGSGANAWPKIVAALDQSADRKRFQQLGITGEEPGVRAGALQVMAERWPDDETHSLLRQRAVTDESESTRSVAFQALAKAWPNEETRSLLRGRAIDCEDEFARGAALETLARAWQDDETRRLLRQRVVDDGDRFTRMAALKALAKVWPDNETRALARQRAVDDQDPFTQQAALRVLVKTWRDDETRSFLRRRAVDDQDELTRCAALRAVADSWPDGETRRLLRQRFADESGVPRSVALLLLAKAWPDDEIRRLLRRHAVDDEDSAARSAALLALADTWPDDETRSLLQQRAVDDEQGFTRGKSLEALAKVWRDDATRALVRQRAVDDQDVTARAAALQVLVRTWLDEETRRLHRQRAVGDENGYIRSQAIRALAENWPDDETRRLLRQRAVDDEDHYTRVEALKWLARIWRDDETLEFLRARSVEATVTLERELACSAVGRRHSRFGGIVIKGERRGPDSYLDPLEPISRDQIENAARKAGVSPDEIEENVASLSEHLGWDITKGARATLQRRQSSQHR